MWLLARLKTLSPEDLRPSRDFLSAQKRMPVDVFGQGLAKGDSRLAKARSASLKIEEIFWKG